MNNTIHTTQYFSSISSQHGKTPPDPHSTQNTAKKSGFLYAAIGLFLGLVPRIVSADESTNNSDPAKAAAVSTTKQFCVFDPSGTMGDAYKTAQKFATQSGTWGTNLKLKAYQDEAVAARDFLNKKCDAVMLTGVRTQQMNRKTFSIEAIGLLSSYDDLKQSIALLARPKAAKLSKNGEFETAAFFPGGQVYLFVRDRNNADVSKLAGKKIATLSFDEASRAMVSHVGATPITADTGTFASLFNEGSVDACYAPALAYAPFELSRGIGKKGGIIRYTLANMTFQVVIHANEFPSDFGQKSREWSTTQFSSMVDVLNRTEAAIPKKNWIDIPEEASARYDSMLREVRHKLAKSGTYDATMVRLLEQLRSK